jgi:hypothetical protein
VKHIPAMKIQPGNDFCFEIQHKNKTTCFYMQVFFSDAEKIRQIRCREAAESAGAEWVRGVRISSETENIAHSLGHTDSAYGSHGVHDDIERLFCVEQAVVDTETESHECDTRAEPQDTAFEKAAVLFPGNTVRGCGGYFNRGVQCDWLVVLVVVLQVHGIQF